jgi:competence protein ComEC
MQAPAALVALPFLLGSVAGTVFAEHPDRWWPLCIAAAAVLSLGAALGFFADDCSEGVAVGVAMGCLLSGMSLAVGAARTAYNPPLLAWFDARNAADREAPCLLEGVLREDASVSVYGASVSLDVTCAGTRWCPSGLKPASTGTPAIVAGHSRGDHRLGGVRLSIGGTAAAERLADWRAGRTLRLSAVLRKPTSYGNPGLPDATRALAQRGVVLVGSVKSAALVEVVAHGSVVDEAAAGARAWVRRQLAAHVGRWSGQSAAVGAAILIGDRSGLSDEEERRLQEAGTYHVIAISGGNIAILTALLLVVLRAARVPPNQSAVLTIASLLFYAQLTGAGASVSRAVTAACVYLGGRIFDHRGPALNALAVAAVFGVAPFPLAAFDAGFILSFGATLGIVVGLPRLLWVVPRHRGGGLTRHLARSGVAAAAGLLLATACAELALAPAGAVLFARITLAGLALNFAAIPLMTVVQGASIASLAASPIAESAAALFGYVAHVAATGLVRSAYLVDVAPWLVRDVAAPSWWLITVYYVSAATLLSRRYVRAGICGITLSAVLMLAIPAAGIAEDAPARSAGSLRVVFLDVGQGDATLVMLPGGRVLLIDAGGAVGSAFDIGERVLAPALRAFGVRRLDTLVITHGDPDHIGGAPAMMRRFRPGAVWEGVPVPPHPALRALAALASASGTSWRTVQAGDRERDGAVEIAVLHPPPPGWERQRVRNDDSIVLDIRIGDVSIVLPGDVGVEGEQTVLPRLTPGSIVILKAPHHGSATSSTPALLDLVQPAVVVFSAGRGNRFNHPSPQVVDRYRRAGALMFRTDEDGAVIVDTDGRTASITTWSGRRLTLRR